MGTLVENEGTGTFGDVQSWSITETATPVVIGDTAAAIGGGSLTALRRDDTELAVDNTVTITNDLLGSTALTVNNVNLQSKELASLTLDSSLGRFISGSVRIPGIASGSPLGALDVACQLSGYRGSLDNDPRSHYWSLRGHTAGFDGTGARVFPKSEDRFISRYTGLGNLRSEVLQYQDIRDAVAINNLYTGGVQSGYPSVVTGPSMRLKNARTYLKFRTVTSAAGRVTWSMVTGPKYRIVNQTARFAPETLSLTYTQASRVLVVNISYYDAAGVNRLVSQTVTGTSQTNKGAPHTLLLEVYANALGQITFRAASVDQDGVRGPIASAQSPVAADRSGVIWTERWALAGTVLGFSDLLIRENAPGEDSWNALHNNTYVNPTPPFKSELVDPRNGAPIASTTSELWDYIKQVAAGRNVDIAATQTGIVIREPGARVIQLDDKVSSSRSVSVAATGRTLAIVNHNTQLVGAPANIYEATQALSVDVGKTSTVDLAVAPGVEWVYSPRPTYNPVQGTPFEVPTVEPVPADLGYYYVAARDNLPVVPAQWLYYGGQVTAFVNEEGVCKLTLRGPRKPIPGVQGPFKLAWSDGSNDKPALWLAGTGVLSDPYTMSMPTGADEKRTNVELAGTVTNVAIASVADVYDRGAWAISRASGPNMTLSGSFTMLDLLQFGIGPGSVLQDGLARYRVDNISVGTGGAVSFTASKFTTVADLNAVHPGETVGQFNVRWSGKSASDFAIRPLA